MSVADEIVSSWKRTLSSTDDNDVDNAKKNLE